MKRNIRYAQGKSENPFERIHLLVKNHKWERQAIGAIVFLGGGLLSPLIGGLLDLFVWFAPANRPRFPFSKISIVFYILTLPLLVLGAHCLDLLERKSPAAAVPPSDNLRSQKPDLGLKT